MTNFRKSTWERGAPNLYLARAPNFSHRGRWRCLNLLDINDESNSCNSKELHLTSHWPAPENAHLPIVKEILNVKNIVPPISVKKKEVPQIFHPDRAGHMAPVITSSHPLTLNSEVTSSRESSQVKSWLETSSPTFLRLEWRLHMRLELETGPYLPSSAPR